MNSISGYTIKSMVSFRKAFLMVLAMLCLNPVYSQTADPTITKLFQNSYRVMDAMRLPGGIYLDALAINAGPKPVALAANGVGLYALCIADAMYKKTGDAVNWDANAESKALQTINEWIRLKNTAGAVNANGLFHRYLDPKDGSWVWVPEHSTIDNAIMAAGFLFCKNYFHHNAEIVSKATTLLNSMDFTAAIPPAGNQLYMILNDLGVGSAPTSPFNEYLVLAWFAKNSNSSFAGYNRAQAYWNTVYSDPTKPVIPKFPYPIGNPILSGGTNYAQPSFHVQFAYYYSNYFSNNENYMTYFANQMKADKTWWQNNTRQQAIWGLGAGDIPGGDYSADAVNNNANRIVSPHIMAGFSPVYPEVRNELIALYAGGAGPAVYKIPGTSHEFLWRYKYSSPTQRTSYVQAVDFSTMIYGLAALPEYLGPDFFKTYNNFNFTPPTSSVDVKEAKDFWNIYPNPFSGKTSIRFELKSKAVVRIDIYAENGQLVRQLVDRKMAAGMHAVGWNGKDNAHAAVKPGVYLCRLSIDNRPFGAKQLLLIE